jgi:hypothetical protein
MHSGRKRADGDVPSATNCSHGPSGRPMIANREGDRPHTLVLQRYFCLRFAEKPPSINIASKTTGRNSPKVIDPSRVRTVVKTRPARPTRKWKATGWWRTIPRRLIFLDSSANQRASRGAGSCADGGIANVTCRCATDDRSRRGTPSCALTNGRLAGNEDAATQCNHRANFGNCRSHNPF